MQTDTNIGLEKLNGTLETGSVVYYEQGTRSWYRVSEADVERLGEMIRTREHDGDEYSHWCAQTQAEQLGATYVSEEDVQRALPELRSEAARAGDLEQVALCDRAAAGNVRAIAECRRVLRDARAQ